MHGLNLSPAQMDALQEVANIGLGNAMTSLAQITGRCFRITVPSVTRLDIDDLPGEMTPIETAVAVYMPIRGSIEGHLAFMFSWESASALWDMVLGDHPPSPQDIGEMYSSAMLEVGNIIISSYLNAIGTLTNIACVAEPPFLAIDMAYPIMQSIICQAAPDEPAGLALDTKLQDTDDAAQGHFLYLPTPGGIGMLFDALGVREAA